MSTTPDFLPLLVNKGELTFAEMVELRALYGTDLLATLMHLVKAEPRRRDVLGRLYGDYLGVAYVDCGRTLIRPDVASRIPDQFARQRHMIAIYEVGGVVTIAMAHPTDKTHRNEAENLLGTFISPVFSFPDQIEAAIEITYQSDSGLTQLITAHRFPELGDGRTPILAEDLRKYSEERSVIDFTRGLLLLALKNRASDIHIEPGRDMVRVRFRIDGVLQQILNFEVSLLAPVVARLKILSDVDISETRRPQDGRLTLELSDRSVDVRFASVPTVFGEKVVLRLLGQAQFLVVPDLTELDFSLPVLANLRKIAAAPNGIFFVTGPTGSGKTTTLYALLKHLNQPGVNILTIENPVEYRLAGINQVQTNDVIDLNFPQALRAFLRLDPDIILVGEVRDQETAMIACRAALTGHLVLTTMHTNSALQSITRLVEIGVDASLVGPSIIGVMAQRLIRRLCPHCKDPFTPPQEIMERYFSGDLNAPAIIYRAKGCDRCNHLGYMGRLAIQEVFVMNREVRSLAIHGADIKLIEEAAQRAGFTTMYYDGLKKVLRGLTSLDELERLGIEDVEMEI